MKFKLFSLTPHTYINRENNRVNRSNTANFHKTEYFVLKFKSNQVTYGQNLSARDANLHSNVNLLPGANLHPGANCVHENGFMSFMFPTEHAQQIQKLDRCFRKTRKLKLLDYYASKEVIQIA